MERLCLVCGKALVGRADKKYCDEHCRNSFNNLQRFQDHDQLKQINQILRRNRAILKSKNPDGQMNAKKEWLMRRGFNFSFHTHTSTLTDGKTCFFCYEYGYTVLENNDILLIKSE